MKRIIGGFALGLLMSAASVVYASDRVETYLVDAKYIIQGKLMELGEEYASLNYEGHIYVPVRFLAEEAGFGVEYEEASRTVKLERSGRYIAESVAVALAKLADPSASGAVWQAELLDRDPGVGKAAPGTGGPVWKVTGTDPAGNRTTVVLNAESGEQLSLTKAEAKGAVPEALKDRGKAYALALDAFLEHEQGLAGGKTYIAVDPHGLQGLDDQEVQEVLNKLGSHRVPVMKASYKDLDAKGLVDHEKKNTIEGVLLVIEKTALEGDELVMDGYVYKTGTGAAGLRVALARPEEAWQVVKVEGTWVS
ncbi:MULTISPECIES: stalk domain-containing protein [Paenibacillus]|uniref:stalk domain-containing protein n=1 Tax=Paenibacillus TaxID=44249 RepID=UPI0022B8E30A|nr:stalk domain-containing protein [Paenibacillus caseinilyticus]MCZ8522015.1 stalk domain-containing protein [Paenibacillus caseinilyticus]